MLPSEPKALKRVLLGITSRINTKLVSTPSTRVGKPVAGRLPVLLAVRVKLMSSPVRGARLLAALKSCISAPSAMVTVSMLACRTLCATLRALMSMRAAFPDACALGMTPLSTKSTNSPLFNGPRVLPLAISGSPGSATPLPFKSRTRRRFSRLKLASVRLPY